MKQKGPLFTCLSESDRNDAQVHQSDEQQSNGGAEEAAKGGSEASRVVRLLRGTRRACRGGGGARGRRSRRVRTSAGSGGRRRGGWIGRAKSLDLKGLGRRVDLSSQRDQGSFWNASELLVNRWTYIRAVERVSELHSVALCGRLVEHRLRDRLRTVEVLLLRDDSEGLHEDVRVRVGDAYRTSRC